MLWVTEISKNIWRLYGDKLEIKFHTVPLRPPLLFSNERCQTRHNIIIIFIIAKKIKQKSIKIFKKQKFSRLVVLLLSDFNMLDCVVGLFVTC